MEASRKIATYIAKSDVEYVIPAGISMYQHASGVRFVAARLSITATAFLDADHAFQYACDVLRKHLLTTRKPVGVRYNMPRKSNPDLGTGVHEFGGSVRVDTFTPDGHSQAILVTAVDYGDLDDRINRAHELREMALKAQLDRQLAAIPTDVVPVVLNKYGKPLEGVK